MMTFDQLAIACSNESTHLDMQRHHNKAFNATFPAQDVVTAIGRGERNQHIENVAHLAFSYDFIKGLEFELLTYVSGGNWHARTNHTGDSWLSHYGVHVEDETLIDEYRGKFRVLQEVVTTKHTNPAIMNSRRYHYVIFNTRHELGAELKFIRRLTLEQGAELVKTLRE